MIGPHLNESFSDDRDAPGAARQDPLARAKAEYEAIQEVLAHAAERMATLDRQLEELQSTNGGNAEIQQLREALELARFWGNGDLVGHREAAEILEISSSRLSDLNLGGRVGRKIGAHYVFSKAALSEFAAIPRLVGKPKKKKDE